MKALIITILMLSLCYFISYSIDNAQATHDRKEHTQYYKEGFAGAIYCIETTHDIELCKKLIKE